MRSFQKQHQSSVSMSRWLLVVAPFLFLMSAVLFNVFSYASLGTIGGELYAIQVKTDQLTAQNQKLAEELAKTESLHGSLSQAESLGFVPIGKLTLVDQKETKVALIHE